MPIAFCPMFFLARLIYIGPIFFLAGSPVISKLAAFNPWSLLHIPLYFILTMLLLLSFLPIHSYGPDRPNRPDRQYRPLPFGFRFSPFAYHPFFGGLPAIIAVVVAIADEAHQSLFPTRSASLGDVFLDLVGIALAIFLASYKMTRKCTPSGPQGGNGSRAPA